MRGRPRKPDHIRVLEGNPGKCKPKVTQLPEPYKLTPRLPSWLGKHGKAFARRTAPHLIEDNLLNPLFETAFLAMAKSWDVFMTATDKLSEEGYVITDNRGVKRKHPLSQVARNAQTTFLTFARDFGLTPMSRQRMPLPSPKEKSLRELLEDNPFHDI